VKRAWWLLLRHDKILRAFRPTGRISVVELTLAFAGSILKGHAAANSTSPATTD
jgi:hypothetical protein